MFTDYDLEMLIKALDQNQEPKLMRYTTMLRLLVGRLAAAEVICRAAVRQFPPETEDIENWLRKAGK